MSYHPMIELTDLEFEIILYRIAFKQTTTEAYKLEQVLHDFQKANLFECFYSHGMGRAKAGWHINEHGLWFLAPHFTNFDTMKEQADAKRGKCHTCSSFKVFKRCKCHEMPLCATCYDGHLKEEGKRKERPKSSYTWDMVDGVHFEDITFDNATAYSAAGSIDEEDIKRMFEHLQQQRRTYTFTGAFNGFGATSQGGTWTNRSSSSSAYTRKGSFHSTTTPTLPADVRQAYKTLGIAENATQADIKAARNRLAKQYHPDLNTENKEQANKRMIEVNKAFDRAMQWVKV